jgi:acyl carrier protein
VAGIAVGNAASGDVDPQGFLLGQGMAPGAQFGSINPIGTGGPGMNDDNRVLNVIANGGRVSNNSWGVIGGAGSGYTARSRNYDLRARDPDPATAGPDALLTTDLGIDSLAMVEMTFLLQDLWGVTFTDEELRAIDTFGALQTAILGKFSA